MACKIEIKKTIDTSIAQFLPNREAVLGRDAARKVARDINELWESQIANAVQYSGLGGYKVAITNINRAVEKQYAVQKESEKAFARNLDFYGGDEALMFQEEGPEDTFLQRNDIASPASPQTIKVIKDFLMKAGIQYDQVKGLVVNGKKLDANGIANVTKSLIQVVEGKEAQALPEEAMHFAVELLEQNDPATFNQLLKEVNSYALTDVVFKNYSNSPLYQTEDGKPDVRKLKKEAMAQILAEIVIKQNEGVTQNPELLRRTYTWWEKILDFLRGLVKKSGFDQVALDVISGKDFGEAKALEKEADSIFLTNTRRDEVYNNLVDASKRIQLKDDPENPGRQAYFLGDRKIKRRVSDLVYNWYDDKFRDKKLTNSEFTNAVNDMKADKGTKGHADMEHIFDVFIDENGFMRETPLPDDTYVPLMGVADVEAYNLLKNNFHNRILSYGKNTRFLKEIIIFDIERDIAGTVDFLAIQEDGTTNILDWKFMDLNVEKYDDVPWYKVNAWNTQMKQYKYIISKVYGVANEEFGHTRMIPIKTHYTYGNAKLNVMPKLTMIEIGDADVKNVDKDYLLPVGLTEENVDDPRIQSLLKKLNNIYKKMSEAKVLPDQKASKAEQLNALYSAIRKLHIQQEIRPLIDQGKIFNIQIDRILSKYTEVFVKKGKDGKPLLKKGKSESKKTSIFDYEINDPKQYTEKTISDFSTSLEEAINYIRTYTNLTVELENIIDETTEEGQKIKEELDKTETVSRRLLRKLEDVDKSFVDNIIAKSSDVKGILNPEKVVKGITRILGTTATIQMKSLQVLYKKANKAFTFAAMDTRTEINRLNTLKQKYTVWANGKGLSKSKFFTPIMREGKNQLIDEFKPEFYKTIREKREEKDYKWMKDNIDKAAYKEYLDAKLKDEIERIKAKVRIDTPEKNDIMEKIEISKARDRYSLATATSVGWLLEDAKKFPKRELWESDQWKELNKPENKPALDFYNYIRERNEYFAEIGYISHPSARTFLPWVRKGLTEKMIFGGKVTLGEQFLHNISLDEAETEFGQIDPLTGQPVDTVPILLTKELDVDYSTDLFKTMGLYNEFAIKFMYLKEIESQMRALHRLEKNKEVIATSYFGKTKKENGIIVPVKDEKQRNASLFEQMMKAIVYQQRYLESEMFDTILGRVKGSFDTINKKLGYDLLPKNFDSRVFSVNKTISQLNNQYQLIVLGWSPLSSLSNLFGGKTQGFINSGKYFTKQEYVKTEHWLLMNKMNGESRKRNLAALEYFLPFTDNYNRESVNKMSLSKLSQESVQDYLMWLMRNSDRAVQTTNFFAFLRNTIVVDGALHNVREYVRSMDEFKDMYTGSQEERDARNKKFEDTVQDLMKKHKLMDMAEVSEDGVFSIPGVDQKHESVVKFVSHVQQFTNDALGNATDANKRLINMTIFGNSAMVFKNWIPRLVDVRTGNLKYNAASDAYEWGRSRMIFRVIYEDLHKSIGNLYNALVGNDAGIERVRKLYEDKKKDYKEDTGKDLEMSESLFIDLVRRNIENQLYDTLFYATLFSLTAGLKALAPDDDEDPLVKNQWRFIVRATDKLTDELGYFYNPANILDLFGRGIFPTVNLINNYKKALGNFMLESYGIIMKDEKLVEDTKVIKYWMKTFPILNQAANFMPMFSDEVAKDLGVRMQSNYSR